ncbi:hypothetical protein BV25DRAFT_1915348 [Artomyces pyxidatus]|uniref:Uncharacterized protein n=1 Tax=Artomyces pyxidatus TaxID=48021 RepID=A0ACB8T3L8_9AGAM|nr:hypothetical protein BV25DRAFT_1915348 [Artomyces pyxidatus]
MLLKFASSDILQSDLLDVHSGYVAYSIATDTFFTSARFHEKIIGSKSTCIRRRRTTVRGPDQRKVAEIVWAGRVPISVQIIDEVLDGITPLFNGCEGFGSLDETLVFPTRLNGEWVATKDYLYLKCLTSGQNNSSFYLNSLLLSDRFIPAPLAGMGSSYLELRMSTPRALAEMIASFLIVEIIRRNVFDLPRSNFDQHLGPPRDLAPDQWEHRVRKRTPSMLSRLAGGFIPRVKT